MKKIFITIFSIFFIVIFNVNIFAADPRITISLYDFTPEESISVYYGDDDEHIYPDRRSFVILMINGDIISDAALNKDGRALVPVRVISEKLGANVEWNPDERSIYINQGGNDIKMFVGSNVLYLNGEEIDIDVPPQIINSITYVPLRFIGETFGANVGYEFIKGFPVAWVLNRTDEIKISEEEAIKIAEDVYFNKFLPSIYNNKITPDNYSEKFSSYPELAYDIKAVSDFGEYYYITYIKDSDINGILVDKYDGSYHSVSSFSERLLDILNGDDFGNLDCIYNLLRSLN